MKLSLDPIAMALCGLATIVSVAVVLVASDLLRRFVLFAISRLDPERRARAAGAVRPTTGRDPAPEDPPEDGGATALPG